jgi:hypothetical protein
VKLHNRYIQSLALKTGLLLLFFSMLVVTIAGCSKDVLTNNNKDLKQETPPMSPLMAEFTMSGKPALNRTVNITFSFSSSEDTPNTIAEVILPEGIEYISGNITWEGFLSENETITLKASIKAVKTGQFTLKASATGGYKGSYYYGDIDYLYLNVKNNTGTVTDMKPISGDGGIEKTQTDSNISEESSEDEVKITYSSIEEINDMMPIHTTIDISDAEVISSRGPRRYALVVGNEYTFIFTTTRYPSFKQFEMDVNISLPPQLYLLSGEIDWKGTGVEKIQILTLKALESGEVEIKSKAINLNDDFSSTTICLVNIFTNSKEAKEFIDKINDAYENETIGETQISQE